MVTRLDCVVHLSPVCLYVGAYEYVVKTEVHAAAIVAHSWAIAATGISIIE